jgi:hypothetical protein
MTLDEFAMLTRRVIAEDGFDDYAPTAVYPGRSFLQVLSGVPATEDIEKAALDWAANDARNGEEFLVAFKIGKDRFKIIRRIGPYSEDEVFKIE